MVPGATGAKETGDVKGGIRGFCMGVRRFASDIHGVRDGFAKVLDQIRTSSARVCRVRDAFAKIRNGFADS